jgi:2,4-dienoyl-CoA reductase-like NADH-dependent reductase (Old Yellow Enzyme family)
VAKAAPGLMLGARMSVTDWVEGGFTVEEAIEVAKAYKAVGAAYICCSSGGNSPLQKIPGGPGYQVHLATATREGAGIATRAVGMIDDPHQAEAIIAEGKADMVAVARAVIADPRWPWRAAVTLGAEFHPAPQMVRAAPFMQRWAAQSAG